MNSAVILRWLGALAFGVVVLTGTSCGTLDGGANKPPAGDSLSSMPHNIPQSWEGQAGFPGYMGMQ